MTTLPSDDLIIVYGALRSGTTVFRLMLDAHPRIANPGEVDFLFDHLHPAPDHPTGWRYDLKALRLNRIFLSKNLTIPEGRDGLDLLVHFLDQFRLRHPGAILSLNLHRGVERLVEIMPDIRIIHMLRDPRDVARSCIGMGWAGSLYYGIGHWIGTETAWEAVASRLAPDQVLTLRYEDLFTDTEGSLGAVCAFFGVEWNPWMLEYSETSTYAPPDRSLIAQWRRKCTPREVALAEGKAANLMRARGYPPTDLARAPSRAEALWLAFHHRASVWRFNGRRYGYALYFGEKVARRAGAARVHAGLRQRLNVIQAQHLK
ncbi:sulfotransferase family protein [Palleronia aestuarii]|uniref:Sulfotransferase family protein n=1 Tax=Palleronia aestuarii TaxID=568105 RepID=A0A2W7N166_9RHOB|nr:sulfotransferase [Palleronia aestuarii]PZX13513.1 sulfotransferase family protein [Palleronia aestuarii]